MDSTGLIPFPVFAAVWLGYGVLGLVLNFSRNLALKRRYLRPYIITAGALFLSGMLLTGFPIFMVLLMAGPVAIVTKLNLSGIRLCERCGTTVYRTMFFQRPRFCSRCGAPLDPDSSPPAA
jgi:hypothetical protein